MRDKTVNFNATHKVRILFIFTFICLFHGQLIFGQTIFESKDEESLFVRYAGGIMNINTANKSIKASFMLNYSSSWRLGFDVSGKSTNGIAPLLKKGKITPGFKINLNIGYLFDYKRKVKLYNDYATRIANLDKNIPLDIIEKIEKKASELDKNIEKELEELEKKLEESEPDPEKRKKVVSKKKIELEEKKKNALKEMREKEIAKRKDEEKQKIIAEMDKEKLKPKKWLNLRLGYENSKYKIFSPEEPYETQISDEVFSGISGQLSYNIFMFDSQMLLGLAIGISYSNNAAWLTEVELTDEIVVASPNETTQRIKRENITARQGKFKSFYKGYLQLSSFWKPSKRYPFGIIGYGRYNYSNVIRSINLGFGIYIVKSKDALSPVAGIIVEYGDQFDSTKSNISFADRLKVNLDIKIPFFTVKDDKKYVTGK